MSHVATQFPVRRSDLVSWRAGGKGVYLVRNRATGETFQFGAEEHFLLDCLDGRQSDDDVRRAFQQRFGQPLSEDDLDEFIHLADGCRLLQRETPTRRGETGLGRLGTLHATPSDSHTQALPKRVGSRVMKLLSASLAWPAGLLSAAARLDAVRLRRLDFTPRPDDILLVTYPRSGTTWMQMILYQLTTDGRMDIPHIADLEAIESRQTIVAPAAGVIVTPRVADQLGRHFEQGDPICVLQDAESLVGEIALPEDVLRRVAENQMVHLCPRGLTDKALAAHVARIALAAVGGADAAGSVPRTISIICEAPNPDGRLRPGMTGHARIATGQRTIAAIIHDRERPYLRTEFWW